MFVNVFSVAPRTFGDAVVYPVFHRTFVAVHTVHSGGFWLRSWDVAGAVAMRAKEFPLECVLSLPVEYGAAAWAA